MMFTFERDDDLEVVWSGGELLPSRETVNDGRWEGMAQYFNDIHKDPNAEAKVRRLYNKVNQEFWGRKPPLDLTSPLPLGSADPVIKAKAEKA